MSVNTSTSILNSGGLPKESAGVAFCIANICKDWASTAKSSAEEFLAQFSQQKSWKIALVHLAPNKNAQKRLGNFQVKIPPVP